MTDTDEAVERAAKALYDLVHPDAPESWDSWLEVYGDQSKYHAHARAALAAADGGEVERVDALVLAESGVLRAENERLRAVADAVRRLMVNYATNERTDCVEVERRDFGVLRDALAALHADKEPSQ